MTWLIKCLTWKSEALSSVPTIDIKSQHGCTWNHSSHGHSWVWWLFVIPVLGKPKPHLYPWISLASQATPVSKFQFSERSLLSHIKLRTLGKMPLSSSCLPMHTLRDLLARTVRKSLCPRVLENLFLLLPACYVLCDTRHRDGKSVCVWQSLPVGCGTCMCLLEVNS